LARDNQAARVLRTKQILEAISKMPAKARYGGMSRHDLTDEQWAVLEPLIPRKTSKQTFLICQAESEKSVESPCRTVERKPNSTLWMAP
jgi:hypothetical protein